MSPRFIVIIVSEDERVVCAWYARYGRASKHPSLLTLWRHIKRRPVSLSEQEELTTPS